MYNIIVIGGKGQGKTPFIKRYAHSRNLFVFDVRNEYGKKTKYIGQKSYSLPDYDERTYKKRCRFIDLDKDKFIEACNKLRNTICVFEEATEFFQGKTEANIRHLIFGNRHTGNINILVFHSINSLPPRIMESSDFIVLFKTADERDTVRKKFNSLLDLFDKVMKNKDSKYLIKQTI